MLCECRTICAPESDDLVIVDRRGTESSLCTIICSEFDDANDAPSQRGHHIFEYLSPSTVKSHSLEVRSQCIA
jgi:hypothetical protein